MRPFYVWKKMAVLRVNLAVCNLFMLWRWCSEVSSLPLQGELHMIEESPVCRVKGQQPGGALRQKVLLLFSA